MELCEQDGELANRECRIVLPNDEVNKIFIYPIFAEVITSGALRSKKVTLVFESETI